MSNWIAKIVQNTKDILFTDKKDVEQPYKVINNADSDTNSDLELMTGKKINSLIASGGGGWTAVDASTTVKGIVKLSTAPVSPTNPIAVGDNDIRNTNARPPTSHASTHTNGTDDIQNATTSQKGLLTNTDWNTFNNKQPAGSYLTSETDPVFLAAKDTDGTLAANSDSKWATQKATKTYADTKETALGYTAENSANKTISFATLNNILYPTTQAVENRIANTQKGSLAVTIDGSGAVITTGFNGGFITIPYSGTITGWDIESSNAGAALSGSIVVDVWKDTYANFPPTVADTIFGTKPNLSTQSKNSDTGLSIAVTAGDKIGVNVDSCTTCVFVNLTLTITKS